MSFQLKAFLRALFLIFSAGVCTCILAPLGILAILLDRSGQSFSAVQRVWANWLLRANGVRLNRKGLENLEERHSYIFISNHMSLLDIPGIISALPVPIRFIAKRSLTWVPIFGWSLSLSGHILIDRASPQSALKSLKRAAFLLKNGTSIMVFPEGTRSPDGLVKEFKAGAFLLAQKAEAPVVPVSISGTYEMLPRTGWCFWPGTIKVSIGKPISTEGLSQRQVRSLMEEVRARVIQNLNPEPQTHKAQGDRPNAFAQKARP
jgi:1-acyl-sn-glycerol-3-phosphate acyltransferase